MASQGTSVSLIKSQLDEFKTYLFTKYADHHGMKILENIGEFKYVIKINQFVEYNLNLTFQIPVDAKISNLNVIVNFLRPNLDAEDSIKELQSKLNEHLMEAVEGDNIFIDLFDKAFKLINQNFDKPKVTNQRDLPKNKKKSSPTRNDADELEKKCSMKTSADVLNRIMWDDEINKDFITVGYLDRFLGIKECLFSQFDWGDIVEADLGALAIPKHRINYFKYKNEIIWNKTNRLDNVFGSTGSNLTIHDVIKRLEDAPFVPENIEITEEAHYKLGRPKKDDHNSPNYFISIPIRDAELCNNLFKLRCDLMDSNDNIDNFLLPCSTYHLTICTLRVDSTEEIDKIKNIMKKILKENVESKMNLTFEGIGEFYNKVLYIKSTRDEHSQKLESIKRKLLDQLEKNLINTAGNYYDFIPHITMLKIMSKHSNKESVSSLVNEKMWQAWENFYFGKEDINEFELCKMHTSGDPVEFTLSI